MILGRPRLLYLIRIGASCLGIAALAPVRPIAAQVLGPDVAGPISAGRTSAGVIVVGRVKDASGKPVPGAQIVVAATENARSARPNGIVLGNSLPLLQEWHGPEAADRDGRFKVVVPGSRSGVYMGVRIYAAAPGHGAFTRDVPMGPGPREVELELGPEHFVRGRVIDLKGQPAVGVRIRAVEFNMWLPPPLLAMWAPTSCDEKGRFVIRGLGPGKVCVQIEGEEITPQRSVVESAPAESAQRVVLSVSPAKRLQGRVVFGDSGKPAAGATIIAAPGMCDTRWVEARTDQEGNFSINPFSPDETGPFPSQSYLLKVFPPPDARYMVEEVAVPISTTPGEKLNVQLSRGVLLKGRVIEAASETPIAGARLQYVGAAEGVSSIEASRVHTAISLPDGRFELPVPPQAGHLLVLGPTPDYVPVETSTGVLEGRKPGAARVYADAVVPVEARPEWDEHALDVRLRRGVTLRGRVVGPDDKPAGAFVLISLSYRVSGYKLGVNSDLLRCSGGQFELPGCDPDRANVAYLFDPVHRLGATVSLTKENATEPAAVRLLPCGSARARLVNADGKPLAKCRPWFTYLLAEGEPHRVFFERPLDVPLEADAGDVYSLDWDLFRGAETDDDGRITFPALVPGAKYRIQWTSKDFTDPKPWPHLDFTVGSGELKDLGVVKIDSP